MSPSETPVRDEFYESLLGDFLDESAQLLDRLNENLLKLDEWVQAYEGQTPPRCDEELLHEMFRAAHSLKGLSAMLGLQDINQLTHKVENVFDAARKDQIPVTRDVVNLIFEAVDRLGALVAALKDPNAEPVAYEEVLENIHQLLNACGAERGASTQADAERALAALEQGVHALDDAMGGGSGTGAAGASSPSPEGSSPEEPTSAFAGPETGAKIGEQQPLSAPMDHTATASSSPAEQTDETLDPLQGVEDEPNLPAKYVGMFIDEAEQTLDELTEILLGTEGASQRETMEKLLVLAHKLKGSAASIGLHRAAKLAHLMEDLLQDLLANQLLLNPALTDALLHGTDALRQFVQTLREGRPKTDHFGQTARELAATHRIVQASQFGGGRGAGKDLSSGGHQQAGAATAAGSALSASNSESLRAGGGDSNVSASQPASSLPKEGQSEPASLDSVSDAWRIQAAAKIPEGLRAILGEVYFEAQLPLVGLKARLIYEKLSRLGEVCLCDPPQETLEELDELKKLSFGVQTDQPISAVQSQLQIAGVHRIVLESWPSQPKTTSDSVSQPSAKAGRTASSVPSAAGTAVGVKSSGGLASAPSSAEPGGAESAKPTETLRVDIERLDQLMNLAGQLVINKARFSRLNDALKGVLSGKNPLQTLERVATALDAMGRVDGAEKLDPHIQLEGFRAAARRLQHDVEDLHKELQMLPRVRQAVYELQEAVHQLDRVTDGLQQTVMQTRMVPIGPLFTRFKRVVRDITRMSGKSAQLVILGEKTELDKRMIDELGDPLIHMVRNAVDHGIEPPEVRESLGKPRQGTVTLEAFHRGNSIVIRVSDDGRGLDADKILRKAIEKGLVSQADAEKMTRQQIYQLIWQPGLSTAEKVTEVSGRGMGMDIVLSKISDLNGTVEIDSTPGKGTTMTIKLPLTLAILPSLMIQIDGDTFALPIEAVVEIVHLDRSSMYTIQGRWTARVRDAVISVVHLNELFTWNQPAAARMEKTDKTTLVILGDAGRQIGLAVDHVLGEEDVVIKSISENYQNVPGLAGASILGDGRVALILDVIALVEMASGRHSVSSC